MNRPATPKPVSPHMLGAVAVLVGVAWTFRTTLADGQALHWIAAPLALFVLGPRWASAAVVGGALFAAATEAYTWAQLPMRLVVHGLVPIGVAWVWLRTVERRLPANLFVYLFVAVFAGTLVAVLAAGALQLWLTAPPPRAIGGGDAWIALLILADGEAMSTGFVVTGLALYRPQWLQTFDADRYLARPPPPPR
jgi:uncharacterized membrane protein